jgi:hypothetical protein
MKYTDDLGNIQVRFVDRPDVVSRFYRDSNVIDMHNQARQFELALEKKWVTLCGYFRLATTLVGIHVTDTWKLAMYHKLLHQDEMSIIRFAGVLSSQLVNFGKRVHLRDPQDSASGEVHPRVVSTSNSLNTPSTISFDQNEMPLRVLTDNVGTNHHQLRYKNGTSKTGKTACLTRRCTHCDEHFLTSYYCGVCSKAFCCPTGRIERDCFAQHVNLIVRRNARLSS